MDLFGDFNLFLSVAVRVVVVRDNRGFYHDAFEVG